MGSHQDLVQGAVIFIVAVIGTLLDGALDALVGIVVHIISSFKLGSQIVWLSMIKSVVGNISCSLQFRRWHGMIEMKIYVLQIVD